MQLELCLKGRVDILFNALLMESKSSFNKLFHGKPKQTNTCHLPERMHSSAQLELETLFDPKYGCHS